MTKLKKTPLAMLVGIAFAAANANAQQTTDIGRVGVEGKPGGGDTGLIIQEDTPKARSSVTRERLDTMNPSSGVFQTIDLLPGVNSFSYDATGLFGGGVRVRGFTGEQMGLTINGAPVNDSGNFAVYPQEYTDTENLCEVFLTQGSTDTEAPHVGASGGNIGLVTCAPSDKRNFRAAQSLGQLNYRRTFLRVDTGLIGPSKFKAFVSYSKSQARKFKGPGGADRDHVDVGAEMRPNADLFIGTSLLYNWAINNNIRTLNSAQIAQFGRSFDFSATPPQHLPAVAGTAQSEPFPADSYFGFNINPFRNYLWTGKVEYKVNKDLTLSAEPYFWYGYGTGGGQIQTMVEGNSPTLLGRGVRDVNGDGDTLDRVLAYGSSLTETDRPGITFKGNYRLNNHTITAGYWLERARHRQTGPRVPFDNAGNSANLWLDDPSKYLLRQDGTYFQARDWLTISSANSLFVQDNISLMNDKLLLQLGLRHSEIKRDFTNYANEGSSSATGRSDGTYNIVRTYSKRLPSFGAKYNLDAQQSTFFNIAQNFRAPSNFVLSNLLTGGSIVNGTLTGARLGSPNVNMETSTNVDLGYRFQSENTTFSGSVFLVNFKNRIAASWDVDRQLRTDYNVGNVDLKGFELEAGHRLNRNFSLYGSLTYTDSQMKQNLQLAAPPAAAEMTAGKQLPDTPKLMAAAAVGYRDGPWFGTLTAKHTGRAYATLVNDESMSAYTVFNLMVGYKLPGNSFFRNPELRLNVDNLFDTNYLRINTPSGSLFTVRAQGTGGSLPSYFIGAPRFASLTLRSDF